MKKILCLLFTLVYITTVLYGCNSLNKQPVTLGDSVSIPEDGVVEASLFETMKQENKTVTFTGMFGKIRYEWIIFGNDIKEAKDLNLGIKIITADENQVVFRFLSKENFGFSPTLSIYLNDFWDAKNACLYEDGENERAEAQPVSITGKGQSILNFSPTVQVGTFAITPNMEIDDENEALSQENEAATEAAAANISDGKSTKQDKYKTDPIPEGKPLPAEPEDQTVNAKKSYTCTFSIECSTIFNNLSDLEPGKLDVLPQNGVIFARQTVTFYEGESVYDVLSRICKENRIHMEASWTPMYNSVYVEGIHNLYEFDCGSGSGWMYRVNGWYPNYGCSRYQLKQGDIVEWRYTCDLGDDIGGGNAIGK